MLGRRKPGPQGAPEWVVTYGDMMSLLLCLFILIASMSNVKRDDRFLQALESIRSAFGFEGAIGTLGLQNVTHNSLIEQLEQLALAVRTRLPGDSDEKSFHGRDIRVSNVREGIRIEIGGRIAFERFHAALLPGAEDAVAQLAAIVAGHNTVIQVIGHATNEPLPSDSAFADLWALSYARARAVGDALERHDVDPRRIRLEAAGSQAPLVAQAYDEETRAANRRVEIVVTEALIEEYAGQP